MEDTVNASEDREAYAKAARARVAALDPKLRNSLEYGRLRTQEMVKRTLLK